MRFQLTINLDNAEAADSGPEALAGYLSDVAAHVRAGYGSGNVRDGNGHTVGQYAIEDGPDDQRGEVCGECCATIPDSEPDMVNAHHGKSCSLHPVNVV